MEVRERSLQVMQSIPESTYIFSCQMSNLHVSLVKKVNHHFGRKGTLMAGRFRRYLLQNPEEVLSSIEKIKKGGHNKNQGGIWKNDIYLEVPRFAGFPIKQKLVDRELEEVIKEEFVKINNLVDPIFDNNVNDDFRTFIYHKRHLKRAFSI